MTAFVPRAGAPRGYIRFCWTDGKAYSFIKRKNLEASLGPLESPIPTTLEQEARVQLGLASRHRMQISFACDSEDDLVCFEKIAAAEFQDLTLHPKGRITEQTK